MLKTFIAKNIEWSRRLTPRHIHEANVFGVYRKLAPLLMAMPNVRTVADVGAGRKWHFPGYYKDWFQVKLIGLDIDAAEMEPNYALDEKIVCDVVKDIPLPDGSLDLITVDSGMEHFSDNERFLENAFAKLRAGGFLIAQCPSRYAPFAIANRLIPPALSRHILDKTMGETAPELGFQAYYDRTNYSAFRHLIKQIGFHEIYHSPGYYSSTYFEFFTPLYLLSYMFDAVRFAVGAKALASYHLWILQKPDSNATETLRLYAWS